MSEANLKPSAKETLRFLRQHPHGASTHDCIQVLSHRFSARIAELRAHGYVIETKRHPGKSSCTYKLISGPHDQDAPPEPPEVAEDGLFGITPDLTHTKSAALQDWEED